MPDQVIVNSVKIRPYQRGDEFAAVELFRQVFNKPMSPGHWLWKFKGRPQAFENVWLAEADGQIIGQYGALPGRLRLDDSVRPILISADAMVHPEYRRRGVLTRLVQHAHGIWRDAGVALALGLPNAQWGSRKQALGWEPLFPLKYLSFPLRVTGNAGFPGPLPGILTMLGHLRLGFYRRRLALDPEVAIKPLAQPITDLDHLWEISAGPRYLGGVRDRDFLAWRYFDPRGGNYHFFLAHSGESPAGYLAYRLVNSSTGSYFHIADALYRSGDPALLAQLSFQVLDLARKTGLKAVVTTAVQGSQLYTAWRRIGFLPGRHFFKVMTAPLDAGIQISDLRQLADWHLTSGDFDIV